MSKEPIIICLFVCIVVFGYYFYYIKPSNTDVSIQTSTLTKTNTVFTTVTSSTLVSVGDVAVFFPSIHNCSAQIIRLVDRANSTVRVAIYSFTLKNIANSLIRAKIRGVDVSMIMEPSQKSQYSQYDTLVKAGIPIVMDTGSGIMHDKVMIVDGKYVVTGSFNWSANAENENAENMLILSNPVAVTAYVEEWNRVHNR